MAQILLAWIGETDLKAARGEGPVGVGPIAQAIETKTFEHVVLLNNYEKPRIAAFEKWLAKRTHASITVQQYELSSPTDYVGVYRAATAAISWALQKYGKKTELTFHLSPGTKAMATTWVILAKTRFDAKLIESSIKEGVQPVDVPFDLAAEFIPGAVQWIDAELEKVAGGLRPAEPKFGNLVGRSEAMRKLVTRARQTGALSLPVLIEGESGTGKELLAAAIHKEGPRRSKPFVVVNCGAIPKDLVESEFFGHVKGAFAGASADHAGHFEQAHGGLIFLDEVGELPLDAQVKLLRVLQEKKVRRIGGKAEVEIDARVIAATNRNLLLEVRAGRFREDLYFRLAVLTLRTPPLREREGDITLLIETILERLRDGLVSAVPLQKKLSSRARNLLIQHDWPGNVRELEATLYRAYVWSKGAVIEEADAKEALMPSDVDDRKREKVLGLPLGDGFSLADTMGEVARHYLARAVEASGGNMTKAASLVGITHYQTLRKWLTKYKVEA